MRFHNLALIASVAKPTLSFPRFPEPASTCQRAQGQRGSGEKSRQMSRFTLYLLILLAIGAIVFAITDGLVGGFSR